MGGGEVPTAYRERLLSGGSLERIEHMPADNKPKRTRLEEIRFELERHAKRLDFEVESMEHYQNFHEEMLEKSAEAREISSQVANKLAELERRLAEVRKRLTGT